jgi:acyl-CoA thioesterase FadM
MALVAIAEHGRSRWLDSVFEVAPSTWPYVLVHLELDFRAPSTLVDRSLRCYFAPIRIGSSSVELEERLTAPDGTLVVESRSVIVAWDEDGAIKRPLSVAESTRLSEMLGDRPWS